MINFGVTERKTQEHLGHEFQQINIEEPTGRITWRLCAFAGEKRKRQLSRDKKRFWRGRSGQKNALSPKTILFNLFTPPAPNPREVYPLGTHFLWLRTPDPDSLFLSPNSEPPTPNFFDTGQKFNHLRKGFQPKIQKSKFFFTRLLKMSYEHRQSQIESFFRIKRATPSNIEGSVPPLFARW